MNSVKQHTNVEPPLGRLEHHTHGGLCEAYARIFSEYPSPAAFIDNLETHVEVVDGVISVGEAIELDISCSVEDNILQIEDNIIVLVADAVNKFNESGTTDAETYEGPSNFDAIASQYDAFKELQNAWDAINLSYLRDF